MSGSLQAATARPLAPSLRVALDLRNPFAYLALEPSFELERSHGVALDWLPFAGHVLQAPAAARDGDDRGTRHRRYRAEYLAREIDSYAAAQGIAVRDPYRDAPATAASHAWLWLRSERSELLPGFLRELFRAYWALECDASDPHAVTSLLRGLGADVGRFGVWARREGDAAIESVQRALREAGVIQTPAYLLEDEVFLGRQHLPMLRWILEGRSGPVPI